ncbi:MAG: DUF2752 domain-containing protein [Flavobacteriia bacterium]|nr:DUF2752 domain-containing protein [Flavobacteriia bacterium]PIV97580.1 MAG: hypothetical protein COW43_02625 [Flavobacteriaceae bacterium CG17_big_fil_post_rev_8_21_14_2_50_31_13]PIX11831.1 MAG: hypothetical protein COZ74_12930 [Flavobacteriaceae bacterium CG_4_8_14_3_um_filter_31_8]PIY14694.1 MAG: hypothetical protein COZ16_07845 [Flavobacteriaceae bacterium CG_4_10_14_3_um_filter_31_253]PIZ10189.1 MAG: hypothetical protein COY55_10240 [Flavobacteriaceae bacterium CG_4_10_14_0_8_um_filter_3
MLPCLSKTMFGFECLGCGLQRSFIFLINGEFWNAFKMYPAIFTLLIFGLFIIVSWKIRIKNAHKIISKLAYINLSIILINYFIKLTF